MAIPNIMNTGHTGLNSAKVGIATSSHNITNANTDGYSRQRVIHETNEPRGGSFGHNALGTGVRVSRVERINDEYLEKQLRNGQRDMAYFEEKNLGLSQLEDIFNEMNGEGINRLVARFFNEFRKLSDEPESPAVRESVREASQGVVNDFHRIRREIGEIQNHIDSRIEGFIKEANSVASAVVSLNLEISKMTLTHGEPNDLLDRRDLALKQLATFFDTSMHKDNKGNINVDLRSIGPFVTGVASETLSVERTPADKSGKPESAIDIRTTGNANGLITHLMKGGKIGALLEVRDRVLSRVLNRLDDMAFVISQSVNQIHEQGVNLKGENGIPFFKKLSSSVRAAEWISLSDEVKGDSSRIATALEPDSPGDNRIALAISKLQNQKLMNEGYATLDEWYNSVISDVGVSSSRNRFAMNQQTDMLGQLSKVREQISGVSIDEETTQLLQYQHVYDASAKVIQIADELLKSVLAIKS